MDTLAFERDIRGPHRPGPRAQAALALVIMVLTVAGVVATGRVPDSAARGDAVGEVRAAAAREHAPTGRPGRRF